MSDKLNKHRHGRAALVAIAFILSIAVALSVGIFHNTRETIVDRNNYVAAAGLFVAALAMERMTELLIAPWVGKGDPRLDRNIVVGSFAMLFGVIISGVLGLRLLALFSGDVVAGTGWIAEHLAPAVDVFATGLAIGAGGKPLHDIISGLEKNTQKAKAEADSATTPAPRATPVPPGSAFGIEIAIKPAPGDAKRLGAAVDQLLPTWSVVDANLVRSTTSSAPGSSAYIQDVFSAAHRLHAAGFAVTPLLSPTAADSVTPSIRPPSRWALAALRVTPDLQKAAQGGAGVKVAVLDTGIRKEHPHGVDPLRISTAGFDVLDNDSDPEDPLLGPDYLSGDLMGAPGHGTGVAAVIAAGGTPAKELYTQPWWDESPMIGVAPAATIVPVRVMRGPVHLLDHDVARGVEKARAAKCDVISMSLGGFAFDGLREQIDKAVSEGIIVVCAAGNQFGVVVEPAIYGNTVAVASIDSAGQPYFDGSSRGPEVAVAAPGVKVLRPDFDPGPVSVLDYGTGTTYAAAHVSGVAALWLAQHDRKTLAKAYPGPQLPQLFLHLLKKTATSWPTAENSPDLAADWGAGIVNVADLLAEPVLDGDQPTVDKATLAHVFRDQDTLALSSRIAGGVGSVLAADGSLEVRSNIASGLLSIWKKIRGTTSDQQSGADEATKRGAAKRASALIQTEFVAHVGASPGLRRAIAAAPTETPIPDRATPELRLVLEESNRVAPDSGPPQDWDDTRLPDDWGVGLSLPLRRALQGVGGVTRGYRWVGMVALIVSILIAGFLYTPFDVLPGTEGIKVTTALGVLTLGVYGGAQAIERLLEFTVGRWAFKNTPGRETDRALILLGAGILVGTLAALVLKIGLLRQIAADYPEDDWFGRADIVVTGLAIGGGAKPVHDLLTRIRVAVDKVTP